jgi:hypothetical protein
MIWLTRGCRVLAGASHDTPHSLSRARSKTAPMPRGTGAALVHAVPPGPRVAVMRQTPAGTSGSEAAPVSAGAGAPTRRKDSWGRGRGPPRWCRRP